MVVSKTQIPEGWRLVRVGDVAEVVMGQSPPGELVNDWDGTDGQTSGLPFIQGNAEFGANFPNPVKWCTQPLKVGVSGDILISVRAPVGETNRADRKLGIGRGLAAVRFNKRYQAFGWHILNHAKEALERVTQGSTFQAIGGGELRNLPVLLPPLPEQRAIAAVLDSIDDAIGRTAAVIAATEQLRDSLLHQLLTRGVPGGHTEWKDVPGLGMLPADWEVVRLGEVLESTTYGTNAQLGREGKVVVLRMNNLQDGEIDLSEIRWANLSDKESSELNLAPGDILFNRTNSLDLVGKVAVVRNLPESISFASYLVRLRVKKSKVDPFWLSSLLWSESCQSRIQRFATPGVSQANINPTSLKSQVSKHPSTATARTTGHSGVAGWGGCDSCGSEKGTGWVSIIERFNCRRPAYGAGAGVTINTATKGCPNANATLW